MSRGTRFPAPVLKPEVAEMIAKWRTHPCAAPTDTRIRDTVLPVVRELVTATAPVSRAVALKQLQYLLKMMTWADRTVGSLSAEAINPRNVGEFLAEVSDDQTLPWLYTGSSLLQQVGRAVNPAAWNAKLPRLQSPECCLPYSDADEALILLACRLPGVRNRAARLWAAAGPLGAGLRGYEATQTEIGDVCELGDGRLAVQVRGRYQRLAPVRAMWTDPVREAISLVNARPTGSSQKFILSNSSRALSNAIGALPWGRDENVEQARMRMTWLAAHVRAGTPVLALRTLAGALGPQLLYHLYSVLDLSVTPEDAIAEGLRI